MNIEFSNEKNALIMKISGEIDHRYAIRIRNEADRKIVTYSDKSLIMDLSGVSFVDSSVIGVIIGRYKLVRSFGNSVFIVASNPSVIRLLEMAGIQKIITVCNTLDDAIKAV